MAGRVSSDPNVFILPDLGEGVHEAELIAWKVEPGQHVDEHEILAEMETDKALVEVPSPRAGVIARLHGQAGEILKVGNPLVTYEPADSAASDPAAGDHATKPRQADDTETEEERQDAGTVVGAVSSETPGFNAREGKAIATPAVRRLARDLGLDINAVQGTGIGGRVTDKDVRAAAGGAPAPASPAPTRTAPSSPPARTAPTAPPPPRREPARIPEGEETVRIPFRGVRRTIAGRLRESVDTAVHFTVMDEADVTDLDALRRRLGAASGERLSFLPLVCSAVCRALTIGFGELNAVVEHSASDDDEMTIVRHRSVHMGIATDTDAGLMVPVVQDCDRLGVLEIGREITSVALAARNRSISRDRLTGSTFTISNVGSHAGRFATPIINVPEVAILAVGRTREGVVVQNGGFRVGKLMPLSLACDHRVIDGATAALCLAEIVRLLQDPEQLLEPARG